LTSLTVEWLGTSASRREARAIDRARRRAEDVLGGRTVWCASALPSGRSSAGLLRASLRTPGTGGPPAGALDIPAVEPLARLAHELQAMMTGAVSNPPALGPAERELYADAARDAETMIGRSIAAEDVVVLHDALATVLSQAARERGAHVVWQLDVAAAPGGATVAAAWAFMRPFTRAVDAYLATWPAESVGENRIERIAALMPSADLVAAKDALIGSEDVRWSSALADVVYSDRSETVGGTLHPRPVVPAR
jgi:hypothetical protein